MAPRRMMCLAAAVALSFAAAGCMSTVPSTTPSSEPSTAPGREPLATGTAPPLTTPGREPLATGTAPAPAAVEITEGDDWSMPGWVLPATGTGFFSEDADPAHRVDLRSVDLSWRQLQPDGPGAIDRESTGSAQGMEFESLATQLAEPGPFWMRVFASGVDWAPEWVVEDCGVKTYGPDYDDQWHLPIWDDCVWGHLSALYTLLFADQALAADPDLRFVYVPGAFTWVEYDYDMISIAADRGELAVDRYLAWYRTMLADLVSIFGNERTKLVFTGEDYPFGPFDESDDLLAREAVDAGMGIRTGISELANFHLSEAPAYGSHIGQDGHIVVDDRAAPHDGRVIATENECYRDCGYMTDDPYYSVRQSNLKSLQLRTNWLYVVPGPSYLDEFAEHWEWVRLSLGRTAADSPDAWAALRDAEDVYWTEDDTIDWPNRPYVRNLERWLVQRDAAPDGVLVRSEADVHVHDLAPENGTAYEGLRTDHANGVDSFYFDLDDRFFGDVDPHDVLVKVTYLDAGTGSFTIEHPGGPSAAVDRTDTGSWKTATVPITGFAATGSLAAGTDFAIRAPDGDDLTIRFVRLVRVDAP